MKKNTFPINTLLLNKVLVLFLLFISQNFYSQVRVPFNPRTSEATPGTSIYHVKGDFTIIGNTNLTLSNYSNNTNNSNNTMEYVDEDNDAYTFNSSSASLTFSTENGAIQSCSKVVFAGLYWTGRASNGFTSPDVFDVTKNGITKTFDKRKVKLKGPNSTTYTEITANNNDIYYPVNDDGFMYSGFAEITDYVQLNGIGNYTVADIALIEGNGGGTGYYGGWGIVVVYENSKMKWRDITIFDGHAYVQGSTTISHQIPISGFNTVQSGPVNIKLGLMAGEGDVGITGDYFNILRSSDNNWQALSHSGNTTNNFFNGSIQTGGNTRNPNLQNNTGLDISMFEIPNAGNSVIDNNQTSTVLRYGSTQDTYVIFMAAFAVDAFIPDAEGLMSLITINGLPPSTSLTVQPGEEIEYSVKILNEGTEPVNNTQIKIQIPYIASYVPGSATSTINFSPLPTPNNLIFNPTLGGNGTLIWDIGTLPVPANPFDVLGELKYKIKVTEDCFLLKNPNCIPNLPLYGFISGIGAITGIVFNDKPFIQGYETSGLCIGDPITDPIVLNIDSVNFINQNCQDTETNLAFNFCGNSIQIPFNQIANNFPPGTTFYDSYPVSSSSIEYSVNNNFPSTLGTNQYYAIPPLSNGCYFIFSITISEIPVITGPQAQNLEGCNSNIISPLVYSETPIQITLQQFLDAGGSVSNNNINYNISYVDSSSGTCPIIIERKYNISTTCSNTELIQTFTIVDTTAPTIDIVATDLTVECDGNGNTTDLQAWLASNGGASASDACSSVTWSNNYASLSDDCGTTGSVSVTFTATDNCGNSSTSSATFTIVDTTAPTIDIVAADLTVECDGNGNTADLQAWLASNGGASASDACSSVTWSNDYSSLSDDCGATGSVSVTFTATDNCGNSSTSSATFTIVDTTAPTIDIVAADLTVECDGNGNTADLQAWLASNGGASASDACSSVTWSNDYSSLSDDCGATGSVSVTFTATDDCGNSSTSSATFTIVDTTAPTIDIVAADLTVECDGNGNTTDLQAWLASNGGASASDACSSVTWSNNYVSLSDDCGATGSVSVTFTATDNCGNSSTSSATFTIVDTTAPTIDIVAADLTVECDGNGNTADLQAWLASNGGASASDACSSVTWSNDYSSLSDDCGATGSVSVTFTATDNCGNSSTSSATFTIVDTTAPTIDIVAADLTVECDGNGNTADLQAWLASNGGASASDSCSSVTWSNNYTSLSDDCGATGSISVTFTATDDCGNSSTSSATFTIVDTSNPIFISNLPIDISVSCDNIPEPEEIDAIDNCSNHVSVAINDEIVSDESACLGEFIILRTWTATDECGNSTSHTQTINVFDNTPPALITPLDSVINVTCTEVPEIPELEFIDNCSGILNIEFNETNTTINIYEYVIVWEWVVSDNCGNEATFTQTINVSVPEPFDAIPFSLCIDDEPINLFTILGESIPTNGQWVEITNSGGLNGNMYNPNNVNLGYYTLQYTVTLDDNDCPLTYEIYLNINDDCIVLAACDIVVYNAVSPNNDGMNDVFFIDGIECYPDNTVEIYNRWGALIYETKGYDNLLKSFKGFSEGKTTFNKNELLPDGTYFYILKYKDTEGKVHDKSGYLYMNK